MTRSRPRSATKSEVLKTSSIPISWSFLFCTLLMLSDIISMWSHWSELSDSLGIYSAAGSIASVTGAAVILSWWLNTDDA